MELAAGFVVAIVHGDSSEQLVMTLLVVWYIKMVVVVVVVDMAVAFVEV